MVSPTIGLGGYRGPESTRGRSASQILEELRRRQRYQLASGGATDVEEAVEGTVIAERKPQYRPYSVFDAIIDYSKLQGLEPTPVTRPTAVPTPTPQPSSLGYDQVTRGPGWKNQTLELFVDLPKALYGSIPADPTMPWDWFSFVERDERTGGPKYFNFDLGRNEDEKASLSRALQLMKGQASTSLEDLQKAAVIPALLGSTAASKIPGYNKIPKFPTAYSDSAHERVGNVVSLWRSGHKPMGSIADDLLKIHRDEPLGTQFVQEATSPFGMLELAVGGTPFRSGGTSLRNVARTTEAVPTAPRLPNIVDQARAVTMRPEHQAWMEAKTVFTIPIQPWGLPETSLKVPALVNRAVHFAVRHVNKFGLADVDNPVHLIEMSVAMRDNDISDAVKGMNSWVLRQGDPKKLFDLDNTMRSRTIKNADGQGAHFFEIAEQRSRKYKLTPGQDKWLKNFDASVKAVREMLVEEGVKDAEFIDIVPKGDIDYFPRIWTMFNDIRLNGVPGGGKPLAGKKKFYENSRSFQFASDALDEKFWTSSGDPMNVVNTLFRGMYTSVADKRLEDLIKPFGKVLGDRVSPRLTKARNFANANVTALKEIKQFVGKVRHARGPARLVTKRMSRGEYKNLPPLIQSLLNVATQNTYHITKSPQGKFSVFRPDGTLVPTAKRGFRNEDSAWTAASNDLFKSVREQDPWVPDDIRNLIDQVTNRNVMRSQWRGRKVSYTYAGEFARRADEASLLTGKDRADAFKALDKDINAAASEARQRVSSINRAIKKAQQAKGYAGEVQFPGTGLSGRVFTPSDMAEAIYKERLVASPEIFEKGQFLTREQLQNLQNQLAGRPDKNWFIGGVAKISSALRTLQAAVDFGAPLIHGLPLLVTDPSRWADSVALSYAALGDRTVMARLVTDHWDTVQKLAKYGQLGGAGSEYVESLQRSGLINKVFGAAARAGADTQAPGLAPLRAVGRGGEAFFGKFETQFDAFLLAAKIHMWEAMEPVAMAAAASRGLAFVPEEELANQVAKLTGSMNMNSMGMSPTLQQAAGGFLMFAPKYRLATYGLMGDIARGSVRGDIARSALGKMAAGGMLMYLAMGYALNQTPNLDPRKGSFFTYEIAGQNIGFGSAWISTMRFLANASSQALTEPDQLLTVWERDSKLNQFIRGQVSPVSSIGWDTIEGKDYMGDPVWEDFPGFLKNMVANRLLPFWASGMLDTPKPGWGGVFGAVPEFAGLRSYPMSQWKNAMYTANTVALQEGGISYEDMNSRQRMEFKRKHPEVAQVIDEASAYMGERGTELQMRTTDYFKGINDFIDNDYMEGSDIRPGLNTLVRYMDVVFKGSEVAIQQLPRDLNTLSKIRDALSELGEDMADFYIRHNEEFADVKLNLDIKRAENMPDMPTEDVAYYDYLSTVILGDFKIRGDDGQEIGFNYRARQEAEDLFIQRWGESIYQLIQERRWMSKETPPEIMELELGKRKLSAYFQIPDFIMEKMGREDLKPAYEIFSTRITNGVDREQHWANDPGELKILKQIDSAVQQAQTMLRERNADWDAWLYRWDYGGNPKHENTLADVDLAKRTPIWFR